ncbi:SBBP repeat-containing protein [uncultured Hymenobacter sp.]|uniref:SBBP repeat-containing protein n=1 Tax=uncultured Hymenobacter sp. TaxID=170016 RepID=UPI0035C9A71C
MKSAFTRLLPLAASLLLQVSAAQAQTNLPRPSRRDAHLLPALPQELLLPPGAPALSHALPATKAALLPSRPAPVGAAQRPANPAVGGLHSQAITSGSATEAWVARFSEFGTVANVARDMVVDAAGNAYVTGYSFRNGSNDFATVKYSPDGQQLWSARYNSAGNGNDVATDMTVDAAGNVYVTGYSAAGASNLSRYITIKYAANGQQLWVGLGAVGGVVLNDRPTDVGVDAAGTVYVTGIGSSVEGRYYYTTLKYSASGNFLGQILFVGDQDFGFGSRLALDAADNLYIAGSNISDYFTRKYSTTGQLQWSASYNGPDNRDDRATSVAVDAAGNVYVTGYSNGATANDYATVKYSASGQQLWATRYNSPNFASDDQPTDLAVDAAGNVFVTGTAYGGTTRFDYATVKYSATGEQLWVALYDGVQNNGIEQGYSLALDAAGDVYVTGYSSATSSALSSDFATVKYASANGQQLWQTRYTRVAFDGYQPVTVAVGATGNVYVNGTSASSAYTTIKYVQSDVEQLWEARFNTPTNGNEVATDVATDAAGNVYVTGYAYSDSTSYDYTTLKYSASGQQLWSVRYNGPANSDEVPTALALDSAGNVYVTGYAYSDSTSYDYATVKYSPSGQQLWSARYHSNGEEMPTALVVDAAGNVVVTGSAIAANLSDYDYATVKYAGASGRQLWEARYSGVGNSSEVASALALDSAGNVYVTGGATNATQNDYDYATLKYAAASGQQLWEARYTGSGNGNSNEVATALVVDKAGNVVVTGGATANGRNNYDYVTVKYLGTNGAAVVFSTYNGPANGDDVPTSIALDAADDAYVTGYSMSSDGTYDYATVKYDYIPPYYGGRQVWVARYNGPGDSYDQASAVAVDTTGNVYVTGLSYNADGTDDYATLKYASASGEQLWEARYNGAGSSYDEPAALALDGAGNVLVTGFSFGSNTGYDYATLKYSQTTGVAPVTQTTTTPLGAVGAPLAVAAPSGRLQELAVYPNPATGPTTVSFRPVLDGAAQVVVYNQLGQQVATLYEGKVRQGQHYELSLDSQKLTAGLYTCALLVGGQRETVRLVIAR